MGAPIEQPPARATRASGGSAGNVPAGAASAVPPPVPAADPSASVARVPGRERTRCALVGAGYIADFHAAVLRALPQVELVAIVDPDAHRAQAVARRHGIERTCASVEELAALRVGVAHLLTPPDTHAALVRRLLALGIGVFAEKPLALSASAARELAAEARARGLALGVNHNNLHHPAFARLLARVRAGEIGRVEHVQVTLSVPLAQLDAGDYAHWMFREPRNIVYEQAVHPLCQVHALLGPVRSAETALLSQRELRPGQVFVDRWSSSARGERGTAQVYLAFGQGFTRSTIQVLGSDGALEADLFHDALAGERKTVWLDFWNSFLATRGRGRGLARDAWRVLRNWIGFTLGLAPRRDAFYVGMRDSIAGFHAALRARGPLPTDAEQAAEVLAWCDAIAAAAPAAPAAPADPPAPGPARAGEVVVLGATGFIGARTVAKLLEAGSPVTVVARRANALPPVVADGLRSGRVRFFRARLEDPAALRAAFAGASAVISLATGNGDTWEAVERAMVQGTLGAAEAARAAGVKRFVYVSSIAALDTGGAGRAPIRDGTATDPDPSARSLYARGKIAAEAAVLRFGRETGLAVTIARPGVVMGAGTPMQHSGLGLWNRDNHCVGWGQGDAALPIVWVDDVADGLARIARHAGTEIDGQALNLCARSVLTAREVVAELRRVTGRDLCFHPRSLALSQALEVGKWLVKKAGRRPGVEFPNWRDLRARELAVRFECDLAREKLGWRPVEDREGLLERCVRVYR